MVSGGEYECHGETHHRPEARSDGSFADLRRPDPFRASRGGGRLTSCAAQLPTAETPVLEPAPGRPQRVLRILVDDMLASIGTTSATWVALERLAAPRPATDVRSPLDADTLRRELALRLDADEHAMGTVIDDLEAEGLIESAPGGELRLTPAGVDRYRRLRTTIRGASAHLLAPTDRDVVQTMLDVVARRTPVG